MFSDMTTKSPPDITVFDIADWFLANAKYEGSELKPMRLQKLVYFAYGWYCAFSEQFLFKEDFYAWRRGLVVKVLYEKYKIFSDSPIILENLDCPKFEDDDVIETLESVWRNYSHFSDAVLDRVIRHRPHSPWRKAYRSLDWEAMIFPETIRDYFKELAENYEHVETQ